MASGKTAAVAELRRGLFGAQKGKWINGRGRPVLTHELGHAYDSTMGRPSASESFLTAYRKDVEAAANSGAKIPDYFLQPGDAGPSEAFAEALSQIAGSPDSNLPMPRTFAWVRSMMDL
jgi:hypothetical protein